VAGAGSTSGHRLGLLTETIRNSSPCGAAVSVLYPLLFVVLFLGYLVYSSWARLDARYPIVAALALLLVAAVVEAAGEPASANAFAEYVFILLAGGIALLLVDYARNARANGSSGGRPSDHPAAETADERKRTAD
jgi:hypothetical protein